MPDYLADTSLIVDLINGRKDRRTFIRQFLKPGDTLGYCTISLVEVFSGMRPGEEEITESYFNRLLFYEVTSEIARRSGRLRYDWRRKGQALSLADATIAAVALHHSLWLLTDNRDNFPMVSIHPMP